MTIRACWKAALLSLAVLLIAGVAVGQAGAGEPAKKTAGVNVKTKTAVYVKTGRTPFKKIGYPYTRSSTWYHNYRQSVYYRPYYYGPYVFEAHYGLPYAAYYGSPYFVYPNYPISPYAGGYYYGGYGYYQPYWGYTPFYGVPAYAYYYW